MRKNLAVAALLSGLAAVPMAVTMAAPARAGEADVVAPDGAVLGTRVLVHPHKTEQPFTRSLGGVKIPENVAEVTLRAHDSVHGYGGKEVTVELPR